MRLPPWQWDTTIAFVGSPAEVLPLLSPPTASGTANDRGSVPTALFGSVTLAGLAAGGRSTEEALIAIMKAQFPPAEVQRYFNPVTGALEVLVQDGEALYRRLRFANIAGLQLELVELERQTDLLDKVQRVYRAIFDGEPPRASAVESVDHSLSARITVILARVMRASQAAEEGRSLQVAFSLEDNLKLALYYAHMKRHTTAGETYEAFVSRNQWRIAALLRR